MQLFKRSSSDVNEQETRNLEVSDNEETSSRTVDDVRLPTSIAKRKVPGSLQEEILAELQEQRRLAELDREFMEIQRQQQHEEMVELMKVIAGKRSKHSHHYSRGKQHLSSSSPSPASSEDESNTLSK